MRRPAVRGALPPVAAAALVFAAFFLSDGSSQSRLFWIGAASVIVAAACWGARPPALTRPALVFLAALAAFVLWAGASIAWWTVGLSWVVALLLLARMRGATLEPSHSIVVSSDLPTGRQPVHSTDRTEESA